MGPRAAEPLQVYPSHRYEPTPPSPLERQPYWKEPLRHPTTVRHEPPPLERYPHWTEPRCHPTKDGHKPPQLER
jgi:hypothetical protein